MLDWITGLMDGIGIFGVLFLMFIENVFPPIPSELIMPLAGYEAAKGAYSLLAVIVAGTVGSLLGAVLWYWLGRGIGADRLDGFVRRHGRWLTLTPDDIARSNGWFERHGGLAVLIGRLIPTVRTFISVPAGVAKMNQAWFLLCSAIGTTIWSALLSSAGYVLRSQFGVVAGWMNPVSTGIVVLLVLWYLWRVVTYRADPEKPQTEKPQPEKPQTEEPQPEEPQPEKSRTENPRSATLGAGTPQPESPRPQMPEADGSTDGAR